jgi:hypothetical protein
LRPRLLRLASGRERANRFTRAPAAGCPIATLARDMECKKRAAGSGDRKFAEALVENRSTALARRGLAGSSCHTREAKASWQICRIFLHAPHPAFMITEPADGPVSVVTAAEHSFHRGYPAGVFRCALLGSSEAGLSHAVFVDLLSDLHQPIDRAGPSAPPAGQVPALWHRFPGHSGAWGRAGRGRNGLSPGAGNRPANR